MTSELAAVADQLIDADRPPSHDEIGRIFTRLGLRTADPLSTGERIGKVKRVRSVASWCAASDPDKGGKLVEELAAAVRAEGGFDEGSPFFIGDGALANVRRALKSSGFTIDRDGALAPLLLDNVPEVDRDATLGQYADRLRRGAADSPLVTGTGKDLLEASARHVLEKHGGGYDERVGLPGTLMKAYTAAGADAASGSLGSR